MGRLRSDIQTSPTRAKGKTKSPRHSPRRDKSRDIRHGGNSIRIIKERRIHRTCCSDPETQKGIGAVLFTLGIPCVIAGLIMTIVAATDDDNKNKYPRAFIAAGPVLLVLAVVLFTMGIFLHSMYARKAFLECFSLDNPDSFCRVHCPALSQFIKPDETIVINQSAMRALKAEPGKPVLKRSRLLSDPFYASSVVSPVDNNDNTVTVECNDVFQTENESTSNRDNDQNAQSRNKIKGKSRGVHFSDGDVDESIRRNRTSSVASDNGSMVSLKHCKIQPINDDIWWTHEQTKNKNLETDKESKGDSSNLQFTEL